MARKGVGGAIAGVGHALMRREDIERQDSLLDREEARHDELLTRQEKREDLMMQRQEALARAREIRQDAMRAAERVEDREDTQAHARGLAEEQMDLQRTLAGEENELVSRRLDDADRRSVEDAATSQIAALDERIIELEDMALQGLVLGQEGEVERQLKEAEDQKLAIRSRLVERLYEMGDPRYKDMPTDQRLYAAGYSKDQVARFMRLAEVGGGEEAPAEEPASPAGPDDAQIASDVRGRDPARVAQYGLSDEDRAALGLEAPAAMEVPASPEPLRDMTQAGRGRRTSGNTRYNTNAAAAVPDLVQAGADLLPARRSDPLNPRGRSMPQPRAKEEPAPQAPASPPQSPPQSPKAAAASGPTKAQQDGMRQSILVLLKPYGGDIAKAPAGVVAAVNVLREQLRE